MHKLSTILLILFILLSYTRITRSEDLMSQVPDQNAKLRIFCSAKSESLLKLLETVSFVHRDLSRMIHENTKDSVAIIFSHSKTETVMIMLYSAIVEAYRTAKSGEVYSLTIEMLDHYIELLRIDLVKAKLFEGMMGDPKSLIKSREQLAVKNAVTYLEVAYNLLVHMKERLEELRQE